MAATKASPATDQPVKRTATKTPAKKAPAGPTKQATNGSASAKAPAKEKPAKASAKPARAQAKKQTAADPEPEAEEAPAAAAETPAPAPVRKPIIPAGQPLPPQPSANEIPAEALETVREVEKTAKRLTLMELTERTCKWPIGDPATEDFWFCGLPVQQGKPYCEAHVGVAFQPMSSRRDRKR